jgi:ABC-type multidrug transport system permease subunit
MLGGTWWPITFVPELLQNIGHMTPQFWFMDAVNGFVGRSQGDWQLSALILALFAVLMFLLAAVRYATRTK